MRIKDSRVATYAIIDTDIGEFRVWPSGRIDQWHDATETYGYFDEFTFDECVVSDIRLAGQSAIARELKEPAK